MFKKNHFFYSLFFLNFLWSSLIFANETGEDTTVVSGGNQIIASQLNMLLDLSETGYTNVLVLDGEGNPVEGHKVQIAPQDNRIISIINAKSVTNESGCINYSILGKQQGETVISVTDGVTSIHINIAVRDLIRYVLPYFYGDMSLSLINASQERNFVKILFHEKGNRELSPVTIRLDSKEMKSIKLSEEMGTTLQDGWVEISSTEPIFGGTWTSKGYLYLSPVSESH